MKENKTNGITQYLFITPYFVQVVFFLTFPYLPYTNSLSVQPWRISLLLDSSCPTNLTVPHVRVGLYISLKNVRKHVLSRSTLAPEETLVRECSSNVPVERLAVGKKGARGRAKREIKCHTEVLRLGIGSLKSCFHKFQAFAPLRGTVESKTRYPVYTLKSPRAASVLFY